MVRNNRFKEFAMIVIAHKSTTFQAAKMPRFWIDPREEAALTVQVYEQYDSEQPLTVNGHRADAAPELTDCYNDGHE